MEALMRELSGAGPTPGELGAASTSTSQTEQEKEKAKAFAAAWEAMLVEGMGAEAWTADKATTAGRAQAQAGAAPEDAFAKTIREAMERMQDSEANLQVFTISIPFLRRSKLTPFRPMPPPVQMRIRSLLYWHHSATGMVEKIISPECSKA
jgi:hypothetical protein